MTAVLAIDAGQTGMKVRVRGASEPDVDLLFPGIRTHEPLLPQLAAVALQVAEQTGAHPDVVAAGVSGLTDRESDAGQLLSLVRSTGAREAMLAHDSITSFLGALGDVSGAVVAAGTGVVALGVGRRSVARVDGWGNIMGDAGSGYWIGREALDAVMRAHDGRGGPTALTDVVRERWPDLESAYIELQAAADRVRLVASFAQPVSELAATDAIAADICRRAAGELATTATAALTRTAEAGDRDRAVCAIGGIFSSTIIRNRFAELLHESVPGVHLESPRGTGLDGTAALPSLAPAHALLARVSVAQG
ncbi:BadF/BadG/BcrA/BcrD ATPase family protein [Microbacterium sp. DT81.1]|uniref:BadF/BadG/BcrA/BcrD ATPase family protein n=1 Tax=Microbacterium sp. DT81.1 TaxID=3393413 RepID=UPI003CF4C63F